MTEIMDLYASNRAVCTPKCDTFVSALKSRAESNYFSFVRYFFYNEPLRYYVSHTMSAFVGN